MNGSTWDGITRIREALDQAQQGTEADILLLRVLKISEEVGEVAEAVHGVRGSNPRKGNSHTLDDVEKELCDVMLTAGVALSTVNPDGAGKRFEEHVRYILDRMNQRPAAE
ncbi:MazG-like family protein [Streptomyces sp. NPDC059708]|uniref:MazG-like family protein n=1 Tax=Streptomyces sp. NPDC059708 TaxID=3346916 RepID=UPI0036C3BA6F